MPTRRSFLASLAAIPVVGALVPKAWAETPKKPLDMPITGSPCGPRLYDIEAMPMRPMVGDVMRLRYEGGRVYNVRHDEGELLSLTCNNVTPDGWAKFGLGMPNMAIELSARKSSEDSELVDIRWIYCAALRDAGDFPDDVSMASIDTLRSLHSMEPMLNEQGIAVDWQKAYEVVGRDMTIPEFVSIIQ
jgi:hypothetical protein